jgi:outer membrane receptor for ferrienterochelin and colicins
MLARGIAAAEPGTICGWVRDAIKQEPLVAANVYLVGTHIGTVSTENGKFCIKNIPPGQYRLCCEVIGYRRFISGTIQVRSGECQQMNCHLQPEVISFKEGVTVTATRGPNLISEVPASVDVIQSAELASSNNQNLAEVLQNVPGVFVRDYGGLGNTKTVSLRGSTAEQVLVLLDGQRLNSPQNGQVDFNLQSLEGIERIEIVRGGNSALYGSDAIGGVINIITRQPTEGSGLSGSTKLTLAAFDSRAAEVNLALNRKPLAVMGTYKYLQSANNFSYTDLYGRRRTRENSDIMAHDLFLKANLRWGDPHWARNLELSWKHNQAERGAPGTIDNSYLRARMWDRADQINCVYTGKVFSLLHDLRLQAYYHDSWNRYKNDELLVPADSRFTVGTYGLEGQLHSVLESHVTLTYGGGVRADNLENYQEGARHGRWSYYLFLVNENTWRPMGKILKSTILIPSLRLDDYSDFGWRFSPKLGTVVNLGERWQSALKFNIGNSYRAPTFNDLYWPADAWTQGNPDLKPEYGFDWDAGVRLQYPILNGLYIESTYFRNRMKDLIIWQERGGLWRPENVAQCLIQGVENSLSIQPLKKWLAIQANYTYLNARNLSKSHTEHNKVLVYRPRHTANIGLSSNIGKFRLNYQFNYTSRRFTDNANVWANSLPPYQVSDASLGFKHSIAKYQVETIFQVKNIFNHEYSVIKDLPIPGREWRLSLKIAF